MEISRVGAWRYLKINCVTKSEEKIIIIVCHEYLIKKKMLSVHPSEQKWTLEHTRTLKY